MTCITHRQGNVFSEGSFRTFSRKISYTRVMNQDDMDEILGISRCVRCGHRLDGDIECPFCLAISSSGKKSGIPRWAHITAYFLASPFSLYAIIKTGKLNVCEKILASSGFIFWLVLFLWF